MAQISVPFSSGRSVFQTNRLVCETVQTDAARYVVPLPPSVRVGAEAPAAGGRVTGWSSTHLPTPPPLHRAPACRYSFIFWSHCEVVRGGVGDVQPLMCSMEPDAALN